MVIASRAGKGGALLYIPLAVLNRSNRSAGVGATVVLDLRSNPGCSIELHNPAETHKGLAVVPVEARRDESRELTLGFLAGYRLR
jgi:hypothetical protein